MIDAHRRLRELASAHFQSRCLHEACERGLFTELARSPASADELASRLSLNAEACSMLCEALAALELLEEREGLYSNAPIASRYLIEGTLLDQGEMVALYRRSVERWEKLAEALHCGHTPPPPAEFDPRQVHAMHCGAAVIAPLLVASVPRASALRLLDLGAGPGTYGIGFATAWPDLQVTLLDLEPVVPIAREYVELAGVTSRFSFQVGDYLTCDLGSDYDVVLLSNILQCHPSEEARLLLKRAFACLKPGGRVVVHGFMRDGSLWPALFSLHLLVSTAGGNAHGERSVREWLREAGFGEPQAFALEGTSSTVVVAGRS